MSITDSGPGSLVQSAAAAHDPYKSGEWWSINVKNLRPLLGALERDICQWLEESKASSIRWDGKSYAVAEYFKANSIDPKHDDRYSKFYTNHRHTLAASYVWSTCKLSDFADECEKLLYDGKRIWIDVLITCQFNVGNVVSLTATIYIDCDVLLLLSDLVFRRAWCLLEAANYCRNGCMLHVVGACSELLCNHASK